MEAIFGKLFNSSESTFGAYQYDIRWHMKVFFSGGTGFWFYLEGLKYVVEL